MARTDKGSTGPRISVTVVPALVIRAGDRVLLNMSRALSDTEDVAQVLSTLRDRFPKVEFTAIGGVENLIVEPAEEATREHMQSWADGEDDHPGEPEAAAGEGGG